MTDIEIVEGEVEANLDVVGLSDALGVGLGLRVNDDTPPEERRRIAYRAFSVMVGKHSKGWTTRLSQTTGIPAQTLSKWRRLHEWDLRFAGEMSVLQSELESTARAVMLANAGRVADRVVDVVVNGNDRDSISAAKLWSEMTGVTVRKPNPTVTVNQNLVIGAERLEDFKNMSDEELFSQAKEGSQRQLDRSLAIRSGQKRP